MLEQGTVTDLNPNRGTGYITTKDGRRVFFSFGARRGVARDGDEISFVKQDPKRFRPFVNDGDPVAFELAPQNCRHGPMASQWGVLPSANGHYGSARR